MQDVWGEIARLRAAGEEAVLVVVTGADGHAPQVVGAKMIVHPDGRLVGTIGGGRVEHVVIARALEVLAEGRPDTARYRLKAELGMCCGGQMEVYMEPVRAADRLVLFGAGHVAAATARVAAMCGFTVAVVDARPDWNAPERFPDATERAVEPWEDWLARATLGARDHVVITTHNHDDDRAILGRVLPTAAGYVGMIGSRRKVARTLKQLAQDGVAGDLLARAHAPIGLDILAETPEEIGVAIVGELIRHRRARASRKQTRGAPVRLLAEGGDAGGEGEGADGEGADAA